MANDVQRAAYLRKKKRDGKMLHHTEESWLADYERRKAKPGRKAGQSVSTNPQYQPMPTPKPETGPQPELEPIDLTQEPEPAVDGEPSDESSKDDSSDGEPSRPKTEPEPKKEPTAEAKRQAEWIAGIYVEFCKSILPKLQTLGGFILPGVVFDRLLFPCARDLALTYGSEVQVSDFERTVVVVGGLLATHGQVYYLEWKRKHSDSPFQEQPTPPNGESENPPMKRQPSPMNPFGFIRGRQ